jgi:hypothetical protein
LTPLAVKHHIIQHPAMGFQGLVQRPEVGPDL